MNKRSWRRGLGVVSVCLSLLLTALVGSTETAAFSGSSPRCVGGYVPAWYASPARLLATVSVPGQSPILNQTLRLVVQPHTGGGSVRVRLSNRYGEGAIELGPVYVGIVAEDAELVAGSNRAVTFGGEHTVTIAAGADALSDSVERSITAFQDVAVSVHVPAAATPITGPGQAMQTSYLSSPGDHSATTEPVAYTSTITTWPFLSGLDVLTTREVNTVVTLGDSITDGDGSTFGGNHRWPDFLAQRLAAVGGQRYMAVANAGIGANQILRDAVFPPAGGDSALRRFSRDAVAQPGVTDVFMLEGTNDIGLSGATASEIIAGMKQLAAQAHAAGLRVHVSTQTPAGGAVNFPGHSSAAAVATRETVNAWIRGEWRGCVRGLRSRCSRPGPELRTVVHPLDP